MQQLGPLQPSAAAAPPKRKPNLPRPVQRRNQDAVITQTDDSSPDLIGAQPPVAEGLRNSLNDYPEHIARLERVLQDLVDKRSPILSFLESASLAIEGCLDTFVDESREKLWIAEQTGISVSIPGVRTTTSFLKSMIIRLLEQP